MDETVTEVLCWINEVRSIRGMQPLAAIPQGVPCDPRACPVARALEADVTFDGVALAHEPGWSPVHLPGAARSFANDFDVGLYPALEEVECVRPWSRATTGLLPA